MNRLIFTPVLIGNDHLIFHYNSYCFINPIRSPPKSEILKKVKIPAEYWGDSGGYQIFITNQAYLEGDGKQRCLIIPGVGIRETKKHLIIDPIDLCKKYGQLNINYGFTLDFPLSYDTSDDEYKDNLSKSYASAKLMFQCRKDLCEKTNLLIPLHYITKIQLYDYYKRMSSLNPDGYAIPVRFRSDWTRLVKTALSLCFLYDRGVEVIHLFGSSRPEIIILGAAAVGLKMFRQISFDSTTWNTAKYNRRVKLIDPKTLSQNFIELSKIIEIELPKTLITRLHTDKKLLPVAFKKKMILLHNILAISRYTQEMAERAKDIEALKRFIITESHLKPHKERLLSVINILNTSKERGYGFIEKHLDWVWC